MRISGQVQSGGSFDVDFSVTAPGGKIVQDGTKERQGDFVFTALTTGEYTFCFNNDMSTFAEKMVDFEIAVSGPRRACTPSTPRDQPRIPGPSKTTIEWRRIY